MVQSPSPFSLCCAVVGTTSIESLEIGVFCDSKIGLKIFPLVEKCVVTLIHTFIYAYISVCVVNNC